MGDVNNDGRDDIAWRNDNGNTAVWTTSASGGFGGNIGYGQIDPLWVWM